MNMSRIAVKCLAWFVAILGGVWAVGGPVLLLVIATGNLPVHGSPVEKNAWTMIAIVAAVLGVLGYLIARQAWKHLRKPGRATANAVAGLATFFLGGECFHQLSKRGIMHRPTMELLFMLGVLVAFYLFYRLVLKRIIARAFPPDSASPTSTSAA